MSIITKILVVLVALAAVVLTPLLVVHVNNATEIRNLYEEEVSLRIAASQASETVQAQNTALRNTIVELNTTLAKGDLQLRAEKNDAERNALALQARINELSTRNQGFESRLAEISSTMAEQAELIDTYAQRLDERQGRIANLQVTVVEQSRELASLQTERDVLSRTVRLLQEQMVDITAQYDDLNERYRLLVDTRAAESDAPIAPVPSVAIRGSIVEVREAGGQIFIAMNVGSNDRVMEGMEFIVHSGDVFLGNAVISMVDRNTASGVMTLVNGDVKVGSQVLAGAQ